MPRTILGTRDTSANKKEEGPCPLELTLQWEEMTISTVNTNYMVVRKRDKLGEKEKPGEARSGRSGRDGVTYELVAGRPHLLREGAADRKEQRE